MYLFGYGSLINIKSAQKSFQRTLKQEDLIPVNIKGYEKVWNAIEFIKFDDNKEVNGVFLNLKKNIKTQTNGVLIKITNEELELLKLREKNYSCITIEASCAKDMTLDEDIITFMTVKKERIAKENNENCFIATKYIDILSSSFHVYSQDFVKEYKKCLNTFPFSLKEGNYTFSDLIQQQIARDGIKK